MDVQDLKKALMRRHEVARQLHTVNDAMAAADAVCGWMGWDRAAMHREVAAHAAASGASPDQAYQDYFRNQLRERLNDAKWEFVETHPQDKASQEIIALARSWQARVERQAPDDNRLIEFPTDEEAYGEPDRHAEELG